MSCARTRASNQNAAARAGEPRRRTAHPPTFSAFARDIVDSRLKEPGKRAYDYGFP